MTQTGSLWTSRKPVEKGLKGVLRVVKRANIPVLDLYFALRFNRSGVSSLRLVASVRLRCRLARRYPRDMLWGTIRYISCCISATASHTNQLKLTP